jgi:hypothetical protein
MSERGTFCMDRGWFDHPEFAAEPFTEREAWAWLIAHAAYKPHARKVGHVTVNLERGQFAGSIRFMAEKWQWSKSRVDRFLARLRERDSIGTESGTGVMVVTICNYDAYQPSHKVSGTAETEKAGQQRDKEEKGNNKYTPPQQRARAHAHEDLGQKEVSETWEPRPETVEQAIQTILFRDKLPVPECRQFTEHEVMRFKLFSRTHGLVYADLDAAFLNFLTKPNRPRERPIGAPLTVVNGVRPHVQAAKPSVVDVLRARIAAREAGSGNAC